MQGKVDSSRLLEHVSLHVPKVSVESHEAFHIPTSQPNCLMNDPLVKSYAIFKLY